MVTKKMNQLVDRCNDKEVEAAKRALIYFFVRKGILFREIEVKSLKRVLSIVKNAYV